MRDPCSPARPADPPRSPSGGVWGPTPAGAVSRRSWRRAAQGVAAGSGASPGHWPCSFSRQAGHWAVMARDLLAGDPVFAAATRGSDARCGLPLGRCASSRGSGRGRDLEQSGVSSPRCSRAGRARVAVAFAGRARSGVRAQPGRVPAAHVPVPDPGRRGAGGGPPKGRLRDHRGRARAVWSCPMPMSRRADRPGDRWRSRRSRPTTRVVSGRAGAVAWLVEARGRRGVFSGQ